MESMLDNKETGFNEVEEVIIKGEITNGASSWFYDCQDIYNRSSESQWPLLADIIECGVKCGCKRKHEDKKRSCEKMNCAARRRRRIDDELIIVGSNCSQHNTF